MNIDKLKALNGPSGCDNFWYLKDELLAVFIQAERQTKVQPHNLPEALVALQEKLND